MEGTRPLRLLHGDCRPLMAMMDTSSVDAVVCDPPYGLKFMGQGWDHGVPGHEFWQAALRVAKPGTHLLAFGGTRTFHRLTCAVEDGGWEIRDCLSWLYGTGFPKSLDVSKAIDKAAGDERPVVGSRRVIPGVAFTQSTPAATGRRDIPVTSAASAAWDGWGTALKPAWEPIVLARKPLGGTVAANVLEHGTGALNVDGCRIGTEQCGWGGGQNPNSFGGFSGPPGPPGPPGRWPANVLLDGEAARLLDGQSGITESNPNPNPNPNFKNLVFGRGMGGVVSVRNQHSDSGGCSRFFYTSKASRSERELGLEALPAVRHGKSGGAAAAAARGEDYDNGDSGFNRTVQVKNHHPTVKPVDLMRWLCRLVTPPGGVVLDPFCGSGSTGIAALEEGFGFIGMDLEAEYLDIAEARIRATLPLFASQLQRVPT